VYAVVKKYGEDGGGRLASTVAYYSFFSVFPALLALVAIAGFLLDRDPSLRAEVVDTAVGQFPVIGTSIADSSLSGSGPAVAVGVVGALWAGLGAMLASQEALNTVWDVPQYDRPDAIRARLRGLLMFVFIGFGLVAATLLTNAVTDVPVPAGARIGIAVANVAVNVILALLAFQILTAKRLRWADLWPGAVAAGVGFYVLQTLGSVVVRRYVADASDTYGTFALVIGLLTWFHLASQVTLLSAEVNVVRGRRLWPRTLFGDDLTDGDRRALAGFVRAAERREDQAPH
jgi:YihY family inner membrane protein